MSQDRRVEKQSGGLTFARAMKVFFGHLEGSGKALTTLKSYELDLKHFGAYLEKVGGATYGKRVAEYPLSKLTLKDYERYGEFLKSTGFKTNTRRRSLLTLRKFLKFLNKRKKLDLDVAGRIPAPGKLERIPKTIPLDELFTKLETARRSGDLSHRAACLIRVLGETGCTVSEVGKIKPTSLSTNEKGETTLTFPSKKTVRGQEARQVPLSKALHAWLRELPQSSWIFEGHNKYGSLGVPLSSRGVELMMKQAATTLGYPELTPRMIRHSVVLQWALQGVSKAETLQRLGLISDYAFRVYEPMIRAAIGEKSR